MTVYVIVNAEGELCYAGGSSTPKRVYAYDNESKARVTAKQNKAFVVALNVEDGEVIDPNE